MWPGGVEVICNNLVSSSQRVISTAPSLISTVMQHLASPSSAAAAAKASMARRMTVSADMEMGAAPVATSTSTTSYSSGGPGADTMQNFAPLGSISSSSPSAGPADVLIQAAPPHRRARSAAWSYHFYPEEAWVDVTITLPCAILLREVQIQPHQSSLASTHHSRACLT